MSDTTQTYQITIKRNLRMLEFAGLLLISFPILMPIVAKIKGQIFIFDSKFIEIMLIVFFAFEIPALILHIQYFIENFKTELTIDQKTKTIRIKKKNMLYDYDFDDIVISKLYKSVYFKDQVDNKWRWRTTFSDYGYWFLSFRDNQKFYFTSLMLDTAGEPLIKGTKIKYPFYPSIKRNELTDSEIEQLKINDFELKVKSYKNTFKHFSTNELHERIKNRDSFQKEAHEACVRLINEKNKNTSANKL